MGIKSGKSGNQPKPSAADNVSDPAAGGGAPASASAHSQWGGKRRVPDEPLKTWVPSLPWQHFGGTKYSEINRRLIQSEPETVRSPNHLPIYTTGGLLLLFIGGYFLRRFLKQRKEAKPLLP